MRVLQPSDQMPTEYSVCMLLGGSAGGCWILDEAILKIWMYTVQDLNRFSTARRCWQLVPALVLRTAGGGLRQNGCEARLSVEFLRETGATLDMDSDVLLG